MLLDVQDLTTRFHTRHGVVHAVEGVSFQLEKGQSLGIVGESGSGKSVTCYSLLGLIPQPPGRIERGTAHFGSLDLLSASERELRQIRGQAISMIFQDPMTSLNPYLRVSTQLTEPLRQHQGLSSKAALSRAITALEEVGIPEPAERIHAYPHQFSGGMRQRVMIAMALITRPQLLIADEPTTALDVTIQKQVLDLLAERRRELGASLILISHDLAVVASNCERVHVMYAGRLVESAPSAELFANPRHAYTRALLRSIPAHHARDSELFTIPGTPPNLLTPPSGCAFHPRNTLGNPNLCLTSSPPPLREITPGHWVQNCPGCLA